MAQRLDGDWLLSPQDLIAEFECQHKLALQIARQSGAIELEESADAGMDLLRRQGLDHERRRLEELPAELRVKRLGAPSRSRASYQAAWDATAEAIADEYDVIYQATLFTGDFLGIADFLILARDVNGGILRDDRGAPVYEPVDTKSARSAKRGAALQVGAYAETMVRLGMSEPRKVHLWLAGDGDRDDWSGPADKFIALAREYRLRVSRRLPALGAAPSPQWAPPREACARCMWQAWCEEGRSDARDLSLVQGIHSIARQRLVDGGLATIDLLASADEAQRPERVSRDTFGKLQAQADIQVRAEAAGEILYDVVDAGVLGAVPPRSSGDLWFDMEGDPHFAGGDGLEYMFGFSFLNPDGSLGFDTTEASDATSERKAFEDFVDIVMQRRSADPGMHVYHYADYERRTLLRLAQKYGTREDEIDLLLREGRLVDLYAVVRTSLRISTPSLSLKDVEKAYGVTHKGEDVSTAMDSVIKYEETLALRALGDVVAADEILAQIRSYNQLDCDSTLKLDTWLRSIAPTGVNVRTPVVDEEEDDESDAGDPHAPLVEELLQGVPVDPAERTANEHGRALMAAALLYHVRERRPAWWQLFDLIKSDPEVLERATGVLVADHVEAGDWGMTGRQRKQRRTLRMSSDHVEARDVVEKSASVFVLYETAPEGANSPADTQRGYHAATVIEVDEFGAVVEEKSGRDDATWAELPIAILPGPPYDTKAIRAAIAEAAAEVQSGGDFPDSAWADLLLRREPRHSSPFPRSGDAVSDIVGALWDMDDSYVAVQGPPGTGKTYVGSRAVAELAKKGWRIGVTAQSHSVIDNFLEAVHEADASVDVGKEPPTGQPMTKPWHIKGKLHDWVGGRKGYVIGGTAWVFSRAAVRALDLDLLVIDEAGQFSLPNAIACTLPARRALLLGDPQQLPQVSQAAHPDGIETSVLAHITGAVAVLPESRGYFLEQTYRMHPELARAVSRLQYEGKLHAAPVTSMRSLAGIAPGVCPVSVEHEGNTTFSSEEADEVVAIAQRLIGVEWTGARDDTVQPARAMTQDDIIVVAAYNNQVRLIRRSLEGAGLDRITVGTVDKFQGRENVVVIVSMATSSAEDLPRGIDFLLSPNRLNVAISRAQWACFLVSSPALTGVAPPSVLGMERLGGFLELLDSST